MAKKTLGAERTRIEIRGIIVSAWYDDEWFMDYVKKGLITPESYIRRQLAEAKGDVEIYINSRGGSVFDGNEMINAMKAVVASGRNLDIVVGAMAASMAANIVAMVGANSVKCHSNTKFMYHGAWTGTDGGNGAHKDTAELLGKINGDIIAALKAKTGFKDCEAWFEEGRMKWLTAEEAKAGGLVGEIIGSADVVPAKMSDGDAARMVGLGVDVAALDCGDIGVNADSGTCTGVEGGAETIPDAQAGMPVPHSSDAQAGMPVPHSSDAQAVALPQGSPVPHSAETVESLMARMAGLQSAKDREIAQHTATITDLKAQLAKVTTDFDGATASLNAEKAEHDKTRIALAECGKQLDLSKAQHAALVGGALKPNDKVNINSFAEAVKHFGGDAAAYVKARQEYPDLYAESMGGKK